MGYEVLRWVVCMSVHYIVNTIVNIVAVGSNANDRVGGRLRVAALIVSGGDIETIYKYIIWLKIN